MANTYEYKCPNCGGSVVFNSETQLMSCPYCGSDFSLDQFETVDNSILSEEASEGMSAQDSYTESDGLRVYICESCGGEIVTDSTTSATSCPFCGNAVVLQGNLSGGLKPDIVVPFELNKDQAKAALMEFYRGKKLLPDSFSDQNHIDEIKGVYIPFWLYSSKVYADLKFKATKVRTWSDLLYNYTETSEFSLDRGGSLIFEGVPVDGSLKVNDTLMESLEPFDWSKAVDFKTAYLSGFFADKYDVSAEDCFTRAKERMENSTVNTVSNTVEGYTTVNRDYADVAFHNTKAVYGLLPVWMLSTTYNGEKYTFAMNGQTGKFVGNLPLDKGAYCKWLFSLTGIIGAAIFLLAYLVWLL